MPLACWPLAASDATIATLIVRCTGRAQVTLRYWACRGRVEFLRCMLHDAEVAFTDEVVHPRCSARNCQTISSPLGSTSLTHLE